MINQEKSLFDSYNELYPEFSEKFVSDFQQYFEKLKLFQIKASELCNNQLTEGGWALHGIFQACYESYFLTIEQIVRKNKKGISSGLRGLVENIGALVWIFEEPQRAENLVKEINISVGRLVAAGTAKYPYLKQKYIEYSAFFHPTRSGHLLGRPKMRDQKLSWEFNFAFSDYFIKTFSTDLKSMGQTLLLELEENEHKFSSIIDYGNVMLTVVRKK